MDIIIKFANQQLNKLRSKLLKDLTKEYYAVLLGKQNTLKDGTKIITIVETIHYEESYRDQSVASINIGGNFRAYCLEKIDNRVDVDTFIDVHTHPFSGGKPIFSSVDTYDEKEMKEFLIKKGDEINYLSIVFSQDMYTARYWDHHKNNIFERPAIIKTQKISEEISTGLERRNIKNYKQQQEMFNRSILALGYSTINAIMDNQVISIVGAGGVGSIIAENLVHMGFQHINLIDFDKVEVSNLNRLVGAYYNDAKRGAYKVECIKRHLNNINPNAKIKAYCNSVFDEKIELVLAKSDWIFMTTDNFASCVKIQDIAFKYYVPFISAATNIIVENNEIKDVRGEVILIRIGDHICLNCLGRIDKKELAYETSTNPEIREKLVQKGYVRGADIKDPAVKTLNSMVATVATDVLINQYTERQEDQFIIVYENNQGPMLFEDTESIKNKKKECSICEWIE